MNTSREMGAFYFLLRIGFLAMPSTVAEPCHDARPADAKKREKCCCESGRSINTGGSAAREIGSRPVPRCWCGGICSYCLLVQTPPQREQGAML